MPDRFSCFIPGNPRPKQRPRLGRGGHVYTPKTTRQWEDYVGWTWRLNRGPLFEGPVKMTCQFYVKDGRHGDLSNLEKAVEDALNGIAYHDDKQITRRGEGGIWISPEFPGVGITIEEVG